MNGFKLNFVCLLRSAESLARRAESMHQDREGREESELEVDRASGSQDKGYAMPIVFVLIFSG